MLLTQRQCEVAQLLVAASRRLALESAGPTTTVKDIRHAFELATENRKISMAMCRRVINYSKAIAGRSENISFFGGNLLGVDRIKFYTADRDMWFDEVLEIDEDYLQQNIYDVNKVYRDWKVASDAFNLSVVWFVHKCHTDLPVKDKVVQEAMVEALVMLQFRFISSAYPHYFSTPVDEAAAEAVYAASNLKFLIRQLGSWGAVFRYRAESFIANDSTHKRTFLKFDQDKAIQYVAQDMSNRTRAMIKDQYAILEQVRSRNARIGTSSSVIELDGERIVRDQVSSYHTARDYLLDVMGNEASFIKPALIDVVMDIMGTASKQALLDVLAAMARTPPGKQRDELEKIADDVLLHAFDYIARNRVLFTDVGFILTKMRALYTSSKTEDPTIMRLRSVLEKYVKKHTHLRASSALASVRTAVMLYLLLRGLSANVYK